MIIRTVDSSITLFEAFAERGKPMTLSELSRVLDIPTSTCFGLMRTLQARGYLYEVGGRKSFYPTARWLAKAREIDRNDPIQEQMRPYLEKLRDATGETVVLSKRMGDAVVYLGVEDSRQAVRYTAEIGDLKPLNNTSSGKALLGALEQAERDELLGRLHGRNGNRLTAAQRSELKAELERSIKDGWFVGRGDNIFDVMGVAAPIAVAGETFAVAVAGPLTRMEPKIRAHAKQLVGTCKALLKDL